VGSLLASGTLDTALAAIIADETRGADLIITAVGSGGLFEASRRVNTGDLVMRAGSRTTLMGASPGRCLTRRLSGRRLLNGPSGGA
jgi:hypothetical protein